MRKFFTLLFAVLLCTGGYAIHFVPGLVGIAPVSQSTTKGVSAAAVGLSPTTANSLLSITGIAAVGDTITTYPYFDDFEDTTTAWTSGGSSSSWVLATPANPVINSAASGINSWITNATGPYNSSEASFVQGPCFDFTNLPNPVIRMKIWWNSEFSWDGANLQSSVDGGVSWQNVGAVGDPNNWYNDNTINGNPGGSQEGWTGRNSTGNGSGGWVTAEHDLDNLGGLANVLLRVAFGSDGVIEDDGFAFDDVAVFEKPPINLMVDALLSPTSNCGLSSTDTVKLVVTNVGTVTVDSINYSYQINGGPVVTELGIDSIPAGQSYIYVFTTTADLSTPGSIYNFDVWTQLSGDTDPGNDSLLNLAITHIPTVATFPYFQGFENGAGGWTVNGTTTTWELGTPDTAQAFINAAASGLNAWVTNLDGGYDPNENGFVRSPCFDLTSIANPAIRLDINYETDFADGAYIEYSLDGGATWTLVGAVGDPNNWYNNNFLTGGAQGWSGGFGNGSNGWLKAERLLDGLGGQPNVLLRVNFVSDAFGTPPDGFGFDNFELFDAPTTDAGVIAISSIESECGLSANESISGLASNLGQDTLTSISVAYSINGVQGGTQTINQTVLPGNFVPFTFNGLDLSVVGSYEICAYTTVVADTNVINDSTCFFVDNQPIISSFPYLEDFENGNGFWASSGTNNTWELATPANPVINSAASGANAWITNANGPYNSSENSSVVSPCFDFSALNDPVIRMNVWWNSEFSWDGAVLQSTLDSGLTWQNVGAFGDPDNWYTDNSLNGNPGGQQEGWSGRNSTNNGSGGWVVARHDLDSLGGEPNVKLRIAFGSDGSVQDDGFAFDDIEIFEKPPENIQAVAMLSPSSGCQLSDSAVVEFTVTNVGTVTLDSILYSYQINGGTIVTELGVDSIPVGGAYTYTFTTTADISVGGTTYTFDLWADAAGDPDQGNDSLLGIEVVHIPLVDTFPYLEDFESGNGGWQASGTNSSWELATPANTVINSAASGVNSWITNATGNYNTNENSEVVGPCFDFSSLSDPVVRMSVWWNSEFSWDGAVLQSSVNDGASWQNVGAFGDPDNWYTDNTIDGNPGGQQEGWTGQNASNNGSGGWVTARHRLDSLGGESSVLLRVAFGSSFFSGDGFAFDDVEIFQNPPFNAKMVSVIEPVSGCGLSDSTFISVQVENVGSATMDSMTFGYSLNGAPGVLEFTPDSVPVGGLYTYTFTTPADMGTAGSNYDLDVWVSVLGDSDNSNDSLSNLLIVHKPAISTFPYVENFDDNLAFPPDNFSFYPGAPIIALGNGWENSQDDDPQDWVPRSTATSIGGTGPSADHTSGNGNYLYVADGFDDNDSVILITPCFDVTGATNGTKFSFWYHSNNQDGPGAATENEMHIDLNFNGTLIYDLIPPIIHKDNNWNFIEIDMSTYVGIWAVRFRVNNNNNWFEHDIAIDDVSVKEILPQDAGISGVFNPQSGCGLGVDTLQLSLENFGTDSIFGVDVNYQINGGTVNTTTVTDTLVPGGAIVLFLGPEDFSVPGTYTIKAWTSNLTGDTDPTNDTTTVDVNSIPIVNTYPYFEDFESGNGGWVPVNDDAATGAANGTWELATPANPTINSAASGVNAYITNATGNYNNSDQSYVIGPCLDFTNLSKPVIEMAVWWESEFSWDGMNLQGSIDGGATWINIGFFGDPFNWYNDNSINGAPGGSQEGWTGDQFGSGSGGWLTAKNDLDTLAGASDVRLRVNFGSDGSVQREGVAFDDIFIYETPDIDMAALGFSSPPAFDCSNDSAVIEVQVANIGLLPQTNIPVVVTIGGAGSGTIIDTIPGPVNPGDTTTFVVGTLNTNAGGLFTLSGLITLAGDTLAFNDSLFSSTEVTVRPPAPTAVQDTIILCNPDSTVIGVINDTSYSYLWYTDPVGGTPIASDTFQIGTGFLTSDTTFYVEAVPGGGGPAIKITEAELLGPDYMEIQNTGSAPVDVTGWTVAIGEDVGDINTVATTQWTMAGVMQPGEIRYRDDAFGSANYWGANIFWNGSAEGWVLVLDAQNNVIDFMVFNYSDTDIQGFSPTINGTTIDITGQWSGPGISSNGFQNLYRVGNTDNNDASDWVGTATAAFAGMGTQNPGLVLPVTGGGSGGGCPSEPRTAITVQVSPSVPVNLGPDAVTCAGFVVNAFDPSFTSYLWNTGETTSSIVADTTGIYYVNVLNADGCVGSDTIALTVLPSPAVDLGPDSLVSCGNTILDAGNPGSSYNWSAPGQFNQTLDVTQTGFYWVEADLSGCTDSDSIYVTILPEPVVDLGADIASCVDVTLDAGNPGATFAWSTGANTQSIVLPIPTGTDTISVSVTNADGCTAVDEIVISVGVPPTVDLGPDTTNCDSIILDAGNPGATYAWSTGATSQSISATNSGPYSVTVTDQFGCENTDDINVTLEFSPSALFDFDWVNFGYSFEFNNLSTPGATYSWDFGDGTGSTDANPTHIYAFDGNYTVTLTVTNDCGTDTYSTSTGNVSIDDLFNQSIGIFPNPTRGGFVISSEDLQAEELTIEVYDAKGAIIYRHSKQNVFGLEHPINISTHPEGVYMVKITDGTRTATKRVIRE